MYAGQHWSKRKQQKDSVLSYAGYFFRPIQKVGSYPIEIGYRFFFATKPLDTLNCAAMAKMFEDALRAFKIIEDDDPKHVARSVIEVALLSASQREALASKSRTQKDKKIEDYVDITINQIQSDGIK